MSEKDELIPWEVPKFKDSAWNVAFNTQRGTQTAMMAQTTLDSIKVYEGEIADEFAQPWEVTILPTNRILITNPKTGGQLVAYMADRHVDARLVLDDYIPELGLDIEPEPT